MDHTNALETLLASGDFDDDDLEVAPALHQSVPFGSKNAGAFAALNEVTQPPLYYRRYGNATTGRLEALAAQLEGGEAAIAAASGMGSFSCAVLALTSSGDHIVAQRSLYGGVLSLLHDLDDRFGLDVTFVDQTDTAAIIDAFTDRTRLVVMETPTNPLLQLTDLAAVCEAARARGILTIVDNTIATPVNQRPMEHGVDLVMHSVTKAMGGHADVQAGVVVASAELVDRLWHTHIQLGAVASPFDAWLAVRGLRTLALRVGAVNRTSQAVAEYLADHPRVLAVNYPGLPTHPQHELARRQMDGFGGLLSFVLDADADATDAVIERLRIPVHAPSLGASRSLVVRPAAMWANELTPEELAAAGVPVGLVRFAVGLEHEQDLIADLDRALSSAS